MKTRRNLNSDFKIASHEELNIFRQKCLENANLMKYYISLEDEKNWMIFRNRINQLLHATKRSVLQ